MTTATRITFDGKAYRLDGQPLPRVSDILSVINKPGLNAWREQQGREKADRISKAAADLGTRVHAACEAVSREMMADGVFFGGTAEADLQPFVAAYERFVVAHVSRVLAVEHKVYHERHRYAGTLDVLAELTDGRVCVLDLKTSKSVDGVAYPLQLAAYATALEEMGTPTDGRMVIHMPSDRPGRLFLHDFSDRERWDVRWRAAVRLYRHYHETEGYWKSGQGVEL